MNGTATWSSPFEGARDSDGGSDKFWELFHSIAIVTFLVSQSNNSNEVDEFKQ